MRAATGLWRWRHNPLRRTTDLIEAWVALTAAVLLFLAVPLAGWAAGASADASLRREARAQARERFPTVARVLRTADRADERTEGRTDGPTDDRTADGAGAPAETPATDKAADQAADRKTERSAADPAEGRRLRPSVVAVWTAPDGTPRAGTLTTGRQQARPGVTFPLWTDRSGRVVTPPMTDSAARAHAVITGFTVSVFAAFLVEAARRLTLHRLTRRRYARLDHAWAQAGPDWGRTGTGS
ncbi:Rv1733c family protein [Streptomyces laurentii]|uniref:Rv1733c family protein n=1 Tax=Streptomyces laurentii TaxID=39478 RepID=UPI0033FB45F9